MVTFGESSPQEMPPHLFHDVESLDYASATRADIDKQNYTVCPRHWYIDARLRCAECGERFTFSADEQRLWYEDRGFYVDSFPRRCVACRREARRMKQLRLEYDQLVAKALSSRDVGPKVDVIRIVDALCDGGAVVADRILESRELLLQQLR